MFLVWLFAFAVISGFILWAIDIPQRILSRNAIGQLIGLGFWVLLGLTIAIVRYACDPEWRYAVDYDVDSQQVTIEKKPRDCDWATAPLGNKNCHYERVITTVLTEISFDGRRMVSYDNRKTWHLADPSARVSPSVSVSWRCIAGDDE